MANGRVVIVGGGPAGHSCAEAYRSAGGQAPVLVLAAEDQPPYERPPLTKEHLRGEGDGQPAALVEPSWYEDHDIEVRLGAPVAALDLSTRTVVVEGGAEPWTACVLATGSQPTRLPVPGGDDPGLHTIRRHHDTVRLLEALDSRPGSVVVVGSGFVGCEAAASLRAHGVAVTMVSAEAAPQHARLGPEVAAFLAGWLADEGVTTRFEAELAAFRRIGATDWQVALADGGALEAAHVVVATGAAPNVALAEAAGLEVDGGVVVDASMRASVPGVLAVGDVAAAWNASAHRRLRVEHWGDALGMGEVAGKVLAGEDASWDAVPGFWSTIATRTLKYAAWGDGWDEVVVDGGADGFTAWYGQRGVVAGVLTHERDDDYERGSELIKAKAPFPPIH